MSVRLSYYLSRGHTVSGIIMVYAPPIGGGVMSGRHPKWTMTVRRLSFTDCEALPGT